MNKSIASYLSKQYCSISTLQADRSVSFSCLFLLLPVVFLLILNLFLVCTYVLKMQILTYNTSDYDIDIYIQLQKTKQRLQNMTD